MGVRRVASMQGERCTARSAHAMYTVSGTRCTVHDTARSAHAMYTVSGARYTVHDTARSAAAFIAVCDSTRKMRRIPIKRRVAALSIYLGIAAALRGARWINIAVSRFPFPCVAAHKSRALSPTNSVRCRTRIPCAIAHGYKRGGATRRSFTVYRSPFTV